jgi:iron complex outermembrane receptor protein
MGQALRGFFALQQFEGNRESNAYEDLEDKEGVEILNGPSSFLYGNSGGAPGGTINYILKRPTTSPFIDATVGAYNDYTPYAHIDVGGPVDSGGIVAVRANVLTEAGATAVDSQSQTRHLLSGAVDVHLANNLLLQFDLSNSYRKLNGLDAFWGTAGGIPFPSAPAASRNYGQPWTFWETAYLHAGTNLTWQVSDAVTIRSDFRFMERDSSDLYENNTFQKNGTFNEIVYYSSPALINAYEGHAFVDIKATTFGLSNKITFGYSGDDTLSYTAKISFQPVISSAAPLTGLSVLAPEFVPERPWTFAPRQKSADATNQSLILADQITVNDQWSMLVGLTDAHIQTENFNFTTNDSLSSAYNKSALTPAGSIIFKPTSWASTYATYVQGIEQGSAAGTSASGINGTLPVANAGAILAPIVDTEYEVGAKANVGASLLTLALFDISRASDVYVPNGTTTYTFTESGIEEHKGVEIGVSGKVTKNLTLWGGLTVMDAKITRNPTTPSLVGTRPSGVSDRLGKIYAEYDIDQVPGLTLTGGIIYAGNYYASSGNVNQLPAYTVANLGVRYLVRLFGVPAIFRLDVDNVANSNYWLSAGYEGDPRSVMSSVQVKF